MSGCFQPFRESLLVNIQGYIRAHNFFWIYFILKHWGRVTGELSATYPVSEVT